MSRLIRDTELIEAMTELLAKKCKDMELAGNIIGLISTQPTAYDVDAVVRELEAERKSAYDKFEKYTMPSFWREAYAYADAIEIVKRGGRNET